MAIKVLTPDEWQMEPPKNGRGRHLNMIMNLENPSVRLLQSAPDCYTQPHSHSEPEVIVLLEGKMIFNGQWCGPGTVVYVPANEDYWFSTGAERAVFAIMRPKDQGVFQAAVQAVAAE